MADITQLKPVLMDLDRPVFAVVDGAQFDDLPAALFDTGLNHRSLYLDRGVGPMDRVKTAPHLLWLNRSVEGNGAGHSNRPVEEADLDLFIDFMSNGHAAVFWVCSSGGEVLYKHLRGINKVLYPRAEYQVDPIPEGGFDYVIFRHADANVMAQIGPVLPPAVTARLLGPAEAILFAPADEWNAKPMRLQRHEGLPPPPMGPLKFDRHTVVQMSNVKLERSRRNVMAYLRSNDPECEGVSDPDLRARVLKFEKDGADVGLKSEGAHARWAFLQSTTGGEFGKEKEIRRALKTSLDPDRTLKDIMHDMVKMGKADVQSQRAGGGA